MHLRADDGIRTRDPHLGKVMRYQLRYIRAPRTRSSPGAKHDDSPRERAHTNFLVRAVSRLSRHPRGPHAADLWRARSVLVGAWLVLVFDVVRLSAPVPWLSGRASASHAEGRWFDPSRDHTILPQLMAFSDAAASIRCPQRPYVIRRACVAAPYVIRLKAIDSMPAELQPAGLMRSLAGQWQAQPATDPFARSRTATPRLARRTSHSRRPGSVSPEQPG